MTSPISTHILDIAAGRPAAGVPVALSRFAAGDWQALGSGVSGTDGRVDGLLPAGAEPEPGTYRLRFDLAGRGGFFPWVDIAFSVEPGGGRYHVPLLLSPFGYSSYRGS